MYFTPGHNPNEIGDFDVVEKDGQLHCFYLCLPSHDQIGHLLSNDGIHWDPLPAALRAGDPQDFDGDQIWTMGVFRKGDAWFMLYTALSQRGLMQAIGLATSTDLMSWTKYAGNPVLSADPRWYESDQTGDYRVDWRDPHVIEAAGQLHGFVSARCHEGLLNHRGCAGHVTSDDGFQWEVGPPACITAGCFDFECPSVFKLDDSFYMVALAGGRNRMVYRVSDDVAGPYRRPPDDSVLPGNNLAIRPCTFQGRTHLFHWQRGERDWTPEGGAYAMLASPKLARVEAPNRLVVESFDWSAQFKGSRQEITPATPVETSGGKWEWTGGALTGRQDDGLGVWLTVDNYEDFILQADLTLDLAAPAREVGLVLRADDSGDQGQYATCIPGRFALELIDYTFNRPRGPQSLWRGRQVKQGHHYDPPQDGKYRLKAIAYGPSIEFNVNGRLGLAIMTMPRRYGRVGVFIEDGLGEFTNIAIQPLRAPECHWE